MPRNTFALLAMTLTLSLAACGTGGNTPDPKPDPTDTTPPSIVSLSPANGATGVAKDANIVVTFSEKMNQASAQAAFQSADLGAVTFSWDAGGTVMTVNPNADLVYTASGKSYSFSVTTTATDLAGNALPSTNSSFTTFKQITTTLPMVAATRGEVDNAGVVHAATADIEVGDYSNNTSRRGFVGFDLSSLPAGLTAANIVSAQARLYVESITGTPFTDLFDNSCSGPFCIVKGKSVAVEHMYYGNSISGSAYNLAPLTTEVRGLTDAAPCTHIICLFVGTVQGLNSASITEWVRDDWSNKAARNSLSELRFSFPKATNADNSADFISITSSTSSFNKPTLLVTYLIP